MQTATLRVEPISNAPVRARRPGQSLRVPERVEPRPHAPGSSAGPGGIDAAVRQERVRIGRELHDTVSQTLYAIALAASQARTLLQVTDSDAVQQVVEDVLELANAGQSELRALLANLRGGQVTTATLLTSGSLTATLTHLAADVRARTGLTVSLTLPDEPDVPIAVKEALVLISREALHNVVKHGHAGGVDIVLDNIAATLVLTIVDDGAGFDASTPRPGHYGLQTMQERASSVGGSLELRSAHADGTHIRVYVPLACGMPSSCHT